MPPPLNPTIASLASSPSSDNWWSLVDALEMNPSADSLSELQTLLQGWPDELRLLSPHWRQALLSGEACPVAALARALSGIWKPEDLEQLLSSKDVDSITWLGISRLTQAHFELLSKSPKCSKLKTLDLTSSHLTAGMLEPLFLSENVAHLEVLDLRWNELGPQGAELIFKRSKLTSLKEVQLCANKIEDAGLLALLDSPHAQGLLRLELEDNGFTPAGILALASSDKFEALEDLDIADCAMEEGQLQRLCSNPSMRKLRNLNLRENPLGPGSGQHLASAVFEDLKDLNLKKCALEDEGAKALARAKFSLHKLDLCLNRIGDEGACALARSDVLASLIELDLSCNNIGDAGISALCQSGCIKSVERLDLGSNELGGSALASLFQGGALKAVELALGSNPLDNVALAALPKDLKLDQLRKLSFSGCKFKADGVRALSQCALVAPLEELDLGFVPVGVAGAKALASSAHLSALKSLRVSSSKIGNTGLQAILQSSNLPALEALEAHDLELNAKLVKSITSPKYQLSLSSFYVDDSSLSVEDLQKLSQASTLTSELRAQWKHTLDLRLKRQARDKPAPKARATSAPKDLHEKILAEPTPKSWEALCKALDRVDPQTLLADVLPQLEDAVQTRWLEPMERSPTQYEVPASWITRTVDGDQVPQLKIARQIRFGYEYQEAKSATRFVQAMVDSPYLTSVHTLHLTCIRLGAKGLKLLFSSDFGARLKHLHLKSCYLNDSALKVFNAFELPNLQTLSLNQNKFKAAGLERFLSEGLSGLQTLIMGWNKLGDAGLAALLEGTNERRLKMLDLEYNQLSSIGLAPFSQPSCAQGLEHLNLCGNQDIDDQAILSLDLPNLKKLGLDHTQVSESAKQKLQAARKGPAPKLDFY